MPRQGRDIEDFGGCRDAVDRDVPQVSRGRGAGGEQGGIDLHRVPRFPSSRSSADGHERGRRARSASAHAKDRVTGRRADDVAPDDRAGCGHCVRAHRHGLRRWRRRQRFRRLRRCVRSGQPDRADGRRRAAGDRASGGRSRCAGGEGDDRRRRSRRQRACGVQDERCARDVHDHVGQRRHRRPRRHSTSCRASLRRSRRR